MKRFTLTIILLTAFNIFSQQITMEVEDTYLNIGEWGTFKVTITGDVKDVQYDKSPDINIKQTGRSSSYNNINGKTTQSMIYTFQFQFLKDGNYNLPLFYGVDSSGNPVKTEPIKVYIERLEDSIDINQDLTEEFESEFVKLFIDLPKRNLYVGEAIPVTVTAFFSTRFQPGIERVPYVDTGSFILDSGEQKASNREKIINGEQWIELTWESSLTPLKAGSLNLEIMVDSYIVTSSGTGFFSNSTRKELTTTSTPKNVEIKQLPMEGRPENFSGAIGDFNIDSALDMIEMSVGDPITLTIELYGYGNFQRVSEPVIKSNESDWKLYNVSSSYNGSNGSNYRGVKTFQQILSPKSETLTSSPTFSIHYFNPIKERYIELKTKTFPIKVNPGISVDSSTKSKSLSFDSKKEYIKHKHSNKYYNFESSKVIYILYLISIIVLLSAIVIKLILTYRSKKDREFIKWGNTVKELKVLESNREYLKALLTLKNYVIQESEELIQSKSEALTSLDLSEGLLKSILILEEEIKYMNREISEEEYHNIKSLVNQEINR